MDCGIPRSPKNLVFKQRHQLQGCDFSGYRFSDCEFNGADLTDTSFRGVQEMDNISFLNCTLLRTNFEGVQFTGDLLFTGSCLKQANFRSACLLDQPVPDSCFADASCLCGMTLPSGSTARCPYH